MELRQLTTEIDRQIFAKCLEEARATKGVGFRESPRSALGRAHLAFGNLYALFENEGEPAEKMVGGFITHDLATFPQSHPKPDVSNLPARSVIEGGELWSLSKGVGRIAHGVAAAVSGILQAKAIILYPMYKPVDLSASHLQLGFVKASEPVRWPYVETTDGREIWAQPLILEGEKLEEYFRFGFNFLFNPTGNGPTLHFTRPFAPRPERTEVVPTTEQLSAASSLISATRQSEERNGVSH
jgi:hypothetical protein